MNNEIFSKIKGVLFDFDGVVVDSVKLHEMSIAETMRRFDIEFPESEFDTFRGRNGKDNFTTLINKYGQGKNLYVQELLDINRDIYEKLAAEQLELVAGAMDFIRLCHSRGKKIAIASSARKSNIVLALEKFGITEVFDAMVTNDDISQAKPHPEVFEKAASALGLEARDCLVIEDADNGIIAAKAAGCVAVGLTTSLSKGRLLEVGADLVVDSFEELEQSLK